MVLAGLRNWRRDRILKRAQLDEGLWRSTLEQIPFLRVLSTAEAIRLRDLSVLFLHEKHFSATADLQLNQPMRLFVAAQACVLILELGLDYYRGWSEIVVYPAQFVPRHQHVDEFGVGRVGHRVIVARQPTRSLTRSTVWSGPFTRITSLPSRVGRMCSSRFTKLIEAHT